MDITARHCELAGTEVGEDEVPSLVDEIPVLAVAAAVAVGESRFAGGAELRVKESDRVASTVEMLSAFGAEAKGHEWGISVQGHGGAGLAAATVDSRGDHRIAMAAAVLAARLGGVSRIDGWEAVATSYPGFAEDLESLGGSPR